MGVVVEGHKPLVETEEGRCGGQRWMLLADGPSQTNQMMPVTVYRSSSLPSCLSPMKLINADKVSAMMATDRVMLAS